MAFSKFELTDTILKEAFNSFGISYQLYSNNQKLIYETVNAEVHDLFENQKEEFLRYLSYIYEKKDLWQGTIVSKKNIDMQVTIRMIPIFEVQNFEGVLVIYSKPVLKRLEEYQDMATDLQVLFDSSYDVIFVSDANGKALRVSSACERLWGKKKEEFLEQTVYELEKQNVFSPSITRMVLQEKRKISTIQKTSTGKTLLVVGTPVKDKDGNIIRVVNASRDITEINKLQSELKEMRGIAEHYQRELEEVRRDYTSPKKLIYSSKVMEKIAEQTKRIAIFNSTVLITGESGVGKEIIASMIHEFSNRSDQPFIKVNCGAIPESLLESELFGYEKGTFTGADKEGKKGLFLAANNGTILLDEITEMPLSLQVKLLRVIQESEIRQIGSVKTKKINVRIIASTNRKIQTLINKGHFREDLYYRLNVIPLEIPPLRERKEDIPLLVDYFIQEFYKEYKIKKPLSNDAIYELIKHSWKGNIRELRNFVERLLIFSKKDKIDKKDVLDILTDDSQEKPSINVYFEDKLDLFKTLESVESQILKRASMKFHTTIEIAEALNVNQSTISKKLRKYNIKYKKEK
ncbi:PAS domain S-box protein [Peribacillus cavernae]|uniref:PAS domain S-box protein n=1 Tax=Peribacillus cavernae TaxID=1674310 RepID=A0A3S0W3T0_9BACI|nr:sigma 54-interacting transcriptional regulator [Peribacillus cavernae]MDQ0219525.1 PAS domain S-box-containing protein [Peribacillus cavernae]RUQ27063.1 PAS domain S-box protein [Peribacillus cavernae]